MLTADDEERSSFRDPRLDAAIERLDHAEGAGVYDAATDLEARACDGAPVVVVGGGKLGRPCGHIPRRRGKHVAVIIPKPHFGADMAQYLVDRLRLHPVSRSVPVP